MRNVIVSDGKAFCHHRSPKQIVVIKLFLRQRIFMLHGCQCRAKEHLDVGIVLSLWIVWMDVLCVCARGWWWQWWASPTGTNIMALCDAQLWSSPWSQNRIVECEPQHEGVRVNQSLKKSKSFWIKRESGQRRAHWIWMGETGFAGNWADGLQYCGTIVQQQRLIAFYLFYSTKPELRLMYKSNVTRQALMLHRLLHTWYFSYRVCMARWVSLWVGSLSLIPSRVVILHSLQHHFIISIHPFIVYHHSCSTQGCWSLSQLWWGEGLVHRGHLVSTLQSQHRDRQLYCHTFTSIRPVPFFLRQLLQSCFKIFNLA